MIELKIQCGGIVSLLKSKYVAGSWQGRSYFRIHYGEHHSSSYISKLTTTSSPARADIRQDYGSLLSMHKTESKTVEY